MITAVNGSRSTFKSDTTVRQNVTMIGWMDDATPARTQVGAKDFDQAITELKEVNWYLAALSPSVIYIIFPPSQRMSYSTRDNIKLSDIAKQLRKSRIILLPLMDCEL